ncbi:hypothetical protein ECANGB1_2712 [Enterospora canceri]|uniref:Uncharacterized protein n=1 Tax=Enterospora canceri TaxID=1081671 RepID=A0A1Y1S698_9MICR|nr:hypothetical protein ECANGB1_2726 [Enterospora canceri]ORD93702.1 hypothetical protein ECANGB1_2712 [Enterospora canceri]
MLAFCCNLLLRLQVVDDQLARHRERGVKQPGFGCKCHSVLLSSEVCDAVLVYFHGLNILFVC